MRSAQRSFWDLDEARSDSAEEEDAHISNKVELLKAMMSDAELARKVCLHERKRREELELCLATKEAKISEDAVPDAQV